jgi:hypothetical protein
VRTEDAIETKEIRASKPISRILYPDGIGTAIIHLAPTLLSGSSDLPESCLPPCGIAGRATPPLLFGLAPCGVFPAPDIAIGAVRSYRTISPLPDSLPRRVGGEPGGMFSVALSVSAGYVPTCRESPANPRR